MKILLLDLETAPNTAVKVCTDCKTEKSLDEFYLHKGPRTSEGYRNPKCKTCLKLITTAWSKSNPEKVSVIRRRGKIKSKYGLSLEEYDLMKTAQNNLCAVCKLEHLRRPLSIDHNHQTGQIRGLLCDKCNMALGLLGDNSQRIKALLNYRESYE